MKIAEIVTKPLKKFRVVYRFPGQTYIIAGNSLIVDARDIKHARKLANEKLRTMVFGPKPIIAWAEEVT